MKTIYEVEVSPQDHKSHIVGILKRNGFTCQTGRLGEYFRDVVPKYFGTRHFDSSEVNDESQLRKIIAKSEESNNPLMPDKANAFEIASHSVDISLPDCYPNKVKRHAGYTLTFLGVSLSR